MLKKILSAIVLTMFVTSILGFSIRPAACATTVLSQNFDSETTGSTPQGWTVANPNICSLTVNDTIFHGISGKSARYADMASYAGGTALVETSFEKQYGRLEFSFAIMAENPDYFNLYIDDGTPSEHHGANIYFLPNGEIAYYIDPQWYYLQSFSVNKWYQIKMTINIPANTYDIYIDGSLVAQGVHFRHFGQATYLTRIVFGGNSYEMPSGYIDDILLTAQEYHAPVATTLALSGNLDYLLQENVNIRLDALVKDINTMVPISNANVTVNIYYPNGSLWISGTMQEKLAGSGVYEWESSRTIGQLNLEKGVYLVQASASASNDLPSTDILLFHIDPPPDIQATSAVPETYYVALAIGVLAGAVLSLVLLKRHGKALKTSPIKLA